MSSSDCGVLSSRGWTGGLSLAVSSPNSSSAKSSNSSTPPSANNVHQLSSSSPSVIQHSKRGRASPSPMNRIPLVRLSEERKAKRCRFYRNGDR